MTELLSLLFKNIIGYLMGVIKMVSPSDWIFIICTLILAIIALFGPYINEIWKRKKFAPKLRIAFQKEYPYVAEPAGDNLYSICFGVKNEGNSKANNCEVIMEEFYFKNKEGDLIENNKSFPAKLAWAGNTNYYYSPVDILPKADKFIHIFYIGISNETEYQDKLFFFPKMERVVPFSGTRIRVPFNYIKIKLVIYSENAKKYEQYIEIKSPGIKRDNKEQILQEMKITLS